MLPCRKCHSWYVHHAVYVDDDHLCIRCRTGAKLPIKTLMPNVALRHAAAMIDKK